MIVYTQDCSALSSGAQHSGHAAAPFSKCASHYFLYPPKTTRSYYNIIDCVLYAALYIPGSIL